MLLSSQKKLHALYPQSQSIPNVEDLKISQQLILDKKEMTYYSPNSIKTYLRVKPTNNPYPPYKITSQQTKFILSPLNDENPIPSSQKKIKSSKSKSKSKNLPSKKAPQSQYEYSFTKIFDASISNFDLFFEVASPLIEDLIYKSKSSLLFAYGVSNSGKTYTIVGTLECPGILPLTLATLLDKVSSLPSPPTIQCSYVEIYNERVYDLLSEKKPKIHIKEKEKVFYLDKVTKRNVFTIDDFESALNDGLNQKIHTRTKINPLSSRSHTIFKIYLSNGASMSIVDLAGAERATRADTKGAVFQETCNINTSLMTLGRCIDAMEYNSKFAQVDKKVPVPIRESKLTKMFQEYFTGEQNVIMLTNINPCKDDANENKNVLLFSCKAKRVTPIRSWINVAKKNQNENSSKMITTTNSGYVSEASSDGESNQLSSIDTTNELNSRLKNQYASLVTKYENNVDEIDTLKDTNEILIQKIKYLESEYLAREYNEIIRRGNDFLKKTYSDLSTINYNLNGDFSHTTNNIFVIKNPWYKDKNESDDESEFELAKPESFAVLAKKAKQQKKFKEIVDSFTIESTTVSAYSESEALSQSVKKGKKKTKKKPKKFYSDKRSMKKLDDYDSDDRNESVASFNNNFSDNNNNDDMSEIKESDENKEESSIKKKPSKKTKSKKSNYNTNVISQKGKKSKRYKSTYQDDSDDENEKKNSATDQDEDEEEETKPKKKKNKKTKNKSKKYIEESQNESGSEKNSSDTDMKDTNNSVSSSDIESPKPKPKKKKKTKPKRAKSKK